MGTELVPETSKNLHILTRLSAPENFTNFFRRESFKTYNIHRRWQKCTVAQDDYFKANVA